MHYSLLVIADGTKPLNELMEPYAEDVAWAEDRPNDAKWDWYVVGGRWRGLITAKIGGHGERSGYDFELDDGYERTFGQRIFRFWHPYEDGRFDVARVRDIIKLDPCYVHDTLTPDGVWHSSEFYVPGGLDGKYFFDNTWFRDGMVERIKERYPDCLAMVVDYHC